MDFHRFTGVVVEALLPLAANFFVTTAA